MGVEILDLTQSNPTVAGFSYDEEKILQGFQRKDILRYEPEPFGLLSARQIVAEEMIRAGIEVDAQQIVLTASTSEAYSFLIKLFCDPGDEVLIPAPSYPLFEHLLQLEGVRFRRYAYRYDGTWHVDEETVRAQISPLTKLAFTINPNNPTGNYLNETDLKTLESVGVPIVSDEVFISYGDGKSVLANPKVPAIALGGLSKWCALPQMKLGWMIWGGEHGWRESWLKKLEIIADSYLSVGTPTQSALPEIFDAAKGTRQQIRKRIERNRRSLQAFVDRVSALTIRSAHAGWYAVIKLPTLLTDEEWALKLLVEKNVYVHPGHFFDFSEEGILVVSLITPEDQFSRGLEAIAAAVEQVIT